MLHARVVARSFASRVISAAAAYFVVPCLLLAFSAFSQAQPGSVPALVITPSTATLPISNTATLSAVDETGKRIANVRWSLSSQIATLQEENGEVFVQGRQAGRATLTAIANGRSATAVVTVVAGEKLVPASLLWSLQPIPGFETLLVVPAIPGEDGPVFYSVEWSKSENAIVRALSQSGQQIWMTRLASRGSPLTLKQTLPAPGQVFQNQTLVSDHAMFIIGTKSAFVANNATDLDSLGLPPDGQSILLHAAGDAAGGIVLLERGRLRDSLVALNPADGTELWRYRSAGRLGKSWTTNWSGDVGIVETLERPASSALLVLNATTGQIHFRIPFPASSSTIDGYRCSDPQRNILKSLRPSPSGSVLTSSDGNIYVQVETHVESLLVEACKDKRYSFDNTLALLSVTPEGEARWKQFQHIHAEGEGGMVAQPRVFAGETIPDGFGGVLAAWTHLSPDTSGGQIRSEARVSRIGPSGQRDFTLPMPYWTKSLNSPFDANMVLGEGNLLYAINGPLLLRLDTESGEVTWVRHPATGEVKLHHATVGGGLLISNAGRLVYFDAQGNGAVISWTAQVTNPEDIGLVQIDPLENKRVEPLQLRDAQSFGAGFIAVEDGTPYGHGALLYFQAQ
jgi:outer membrane protein assembly factor BamB